MTEQSVSATAAHPSGFRDWKRALIYLMLVIGAVVSVFPFFFMVTSAFKSYGSIITNNFWPWPPFGTEAPQFVNFGQAITTVGWDKSWNTWLFLRYFANSGVVALGVTTGVLITSTCAAYALAQMNIPGKNVVFVMILATIMVPNDLTLVPKVVMMYQLNWYNTYLALIVPFLTSVFAIFLLRQFFLQIPKELYDAAVIDGAGHVRYLWSIVVPLSRPAVVTIALLQFIWSWDEFKWPLLVTRDASMRVVAVGLQQFNVGEGGTKTQLLMAFATVVVVPVIIGYVFTQRYFTQGFLTSGIKG
jgi:multiple sugar transport system permease protein